MVPVRSMGKCLDKEVEPYLPEIKFELMKVNLEWGSCLVQLTTQALE